jgi:hypothetical protein
MARPSHRTPRATRPGTGRRGLAAAFPALALLLIGGLAGCGGSAPEDATSEPDPSPEVVAGLAARLAELHPAPLAPDLSRLEHDELSLLDRLIEACRPVDDVFLRQADARNPQLRRLLRTLSLPDQDALLATFDAHFGIYERHRQGRPFVTGLGPRPAGAGLYPEDLTVEQWRAYLDSHPDREAELIAMTTVVRRRAEELVGIPYSEAYAAAIEQIRQALQQAARQTRNSSLERYLRALDRALNEDHYAPAEAAWVDVVANVGLTLGPHETTEDRLFGYKAVFEAMVTVTDADATARAQRLARALGGTSAPPRLDVADLAFAAGRARTAPLTVAFTLPANQRVRSQRGERTIVLRNVAAAKAVHLLRPIAERSLPAPLAAAVDEDAYLDLALAHQLAHRLRGAGPQGAHAGGTREEALLETAPMLEELRADAWALRGLLTLAEEERDADRATALAATWLADLLRRARLDGTPEAALATLQLNLLAEQSGLEGAPPLSVTATAAREAAASWLTRIERLEAERDYHGARELLDRHGSFPVPLRRTLDRLGELPRGLRPIFPSAETAGGPGLLARDPRR